MASDRDLQDPVFDLGKPRGTQPAVSYIVCSTPRCGSTLLSEGMWASNAMGVPMEYFNQVFIPPLCTRWGCTSLAEYLQDLLAQRTDGTGAFGIKMHWAQMVQFHSDYRRQQGMPPLPAISDALIHRDRFRFMSSAFPNARYIHITRLNRIRQAVSWYVGSITKEWCRMEGQTAPTQRAALPYDFGAIHRHLLAIDAAEACWREFFNINDIRPITVVYEDLEHRYVQGIGELLETLGLPAVELPQPRLNRQADETTEVLVQQMTRDLNSAAALL